ncbi:SGNH/GDSL hydrolase family protein [Tumebacillus permanentifrigoris]|uniref:Lysophospholipase L1-like esterase n=1 Tax=Tumebacillus permanentifrigoris TaxID=378543 RepID=A0A316DEF0_9BACL|nr:GDSL-type esterase/lipase family protein [Tumebacillus permanentifrigoris]PWK15922.1 lysophospholipase L1-like esterase [Tumebacillus permanentifrigoris]
MPPSTRKTLVALGDSITAGVGGTWNRGYPTHLAKRLEAQHADLKLVNWGIPGLTIPRLTKALRKGDHLYDTLATADWIVMTIGGNDVINLFPKRFDESEPLTLQSQTIARELDLLMTTLISLTTCPIYLGNLYNPFPQSELAAHLIGALNRLHLTPLAKRYQHVHLVPLSNVLRGEEPRAIQYFKTGSIQDMKKYFRRPIHPNDHGHELIAEAFYRAICNGQQP